MKRTMIALALFSACGGSEPAPSRPAPAAPVDAGVAPDAFVFASLTGDGTIEKPRSPVDVDKAIIRRSLRPHMTSIRACYEQQLAAKPTLAGTVTVSFTIAETGDVSQATARDVDVDLDRCIETEILRVKFPKPKGGTVAVSYPFTFHR